MKDDESIITDVMTTLGNIGRVEKNITKAPVKVVRILHRIVYNQEGDRRNRKRLRQFEGFTFDADSDEYKNKVSSLRRDFDEKDLAATCSLLCLDYSGEKGELANRIIEGLRDLAIIEEAAGKEEDEDEAEEDDEEESEREEIQEKVKNKSTLSRIFISRHRFLSGWRRDLRLGCLP